MSQCVSSEAVSILFVDHSIDDYQQLLSGIKPDIRTHLLNSKEDGVQQITRILQDRYSGNCIREIHIVSHGSSWEALPRQHKPGAR